MVRCGLGMQKCAMLNATIQKTTCFELGVYSQTYSRIYVTMPNYLYLDTTSYKYSIELFNVLHTDLNELSSHFTVY